MRNKPSLTPIAAASCGREAGVRRGGRVAHQGLRAAERGGHAGQPQRVEELRGGVAATDQLDRQHRAAVAHLALGEVELRMREQAGVVHRGDRRFLGQHLGNVQRRRRLVGGAHGQRANAADGVERVVRRRCGAVQHRVRPDGVDQFAARRRSRRALRR